MVSIRPWIGSDLEAETGSVSFDGECCREIRDACVLIRENPLPLLTLCPSDLKMPACRRLMREVREMLERGWGFCIIDRLPLDAMTENEAKTVYWLLAKMLGRPVAQKWSDGRMLYSETDLGKPSGNGVRPDVTNEDQSFHTDNSYNICPPDFVGLLCLKPAMEGGISRVVNMLAVLERMAKRHNDLLSRLYQPYFFDRQREHAPEDRKTLFNPILCEEPDGLRVRVSRNLIYQGYSLESRLVDDEGEASLEAFFSIVNDPVMYKQFRFKEGQIQFLNNKLIGHKRTSFTDWPNKEKKRHLLRVWLREKGRQFYNG